jgi:hypothetical protein
MSRYILLIVMIALTSGCGPSAKEKYDDAVRELERAQARLDNLLPDYNAARATAINATCREIAGTTPEESASAALQGLGDLNQAVLPQAGATSKDDSTKGATKGKKSDDLDKTIDGLVAAQKNAQEKQAALTAPLAKANEVMSKIKTPGTPEAKRMEEKLAAMPEAQAYMRQQKRVADAQKDVDEAKTALPK